MELEVRASASVKGIVAKQPVPSSSQVRHGYRGALQDRFYMSCTQTMLHRA